MRRIERWMVIGACVVALAGMLAAPAVGDEAASKAALGTAGGMRDALTRLGAGTEVELALANGKSYRGKLGSVGDRTVLLTEIAGKEFYDVLIDLDEVAALEVRVRGR